MCSALSLSLSLDIYMTKYFKMDMNSICFLHFLSVYQVLNEKKSMGSKLGICALPENKRIFPAFLEIFGLVCAISALNLWCVPPPPLFLYISEK